MILIFQIIKIIFYKIMQNILFKVNDLIILIQIIIIKINTKTNKDVKFY